MRKTPASLCPPPGPLIASIAVLMALVCAGCSRSLRSVHPVDNRPLFLDVAAHSGVRFRQSNGATGKLYYVEATGSGCAFFDYDGDGFLDILMVQSGPIPRTPGNSPQKWCRLYHNNRNGTFTDVTAGSGFDRDLGYGQGVTIGDFDNDGFDDVFITGYAGNHLMRNLNGSGRFEDVSARAGVSETGGAPQYATSAAFGDFDNDGHLDLYVCHYSPWTIATNQRCGNSRRERDYCNPDTLEPSVHRLYRNNGDGTFTDVTSSGGIGSARGRGLAVAWLDQDGDGREDIFVTNDLTPAFLWHNDGNGKFTNQALELGCALDETGNPMAGMGIGIGDYDNSGRESLYVSNFSQQPDELFRNTGPEGFSNVTSSSGLARPHLPFLTFGCEFIDYDADGWKDIVDADGHVELHIAETNPGTTYRERKQLFHNEGNGTFSEVLHGLGDLATPTVSRGLAVGDYDNDGRLDILVCNQNGQAQLFHNNVHSGNHWISLKAVGVRCNRDGYGAKVTVRCGNRRFYSEVHSSSSYASHSDSRVYFGLGNAVHADSIQVRWPDGHTDTAGQTPADCCYIVTEEKGVAPAGRRASALLSRVLRTEGLLAGGTGSEVQTALHSEVAPSSARG